MKRINLKYSLYVLVILFFLILIGAIITIIYKTSDSGSKNVHYYLSKNTIDLNITSFLNKNNWYNSAADRDSDSNKITEIKINNTYFYYSKDDKRYEYFVYLKISGSASPIILSIGNPSTIITLNSILYNINWGNNFNLYFDKKNTNLLNRKIIFAILQDAVGSEEAPKPYHRTFLGKTSNFKLYVPNIISDQSQNGDWTYVSCDVDNTEWDEPQSNLYIFSLVFGGKNKDEIRKSIIYGVQDVFGYKPGVAPKN